ncbi:MAG: hypothetical protein CM15mP125_0240 [Gammaproteobacteria bacterium]|nr:MAG: hypothetical protein CM15mP125_0240 [Gammaproteobacteria bacterium]
MPVIQGWGMTETSPMCVLSHPPKDLNGETETYWRLKSGRPVPGIEVRVMDDEGNLLEQDGTTVGELQLKGAWVTGSYINEETDAFTEDGWLRTGDVGMVDARGYVQLTDRTKDVIKSGGEWISSVDLEDVLLKHRVWQRSQWWRLTIRVGRSVRSPLCAARQGAMVRPCLASYAHF